MSRDVAAAIMIVRNRTQIPYHPTVASRDEKLTMLAVNIVEHIIRKKDVWAYINWIKFMEAEFLSDLAEIDWGVLAAQMGCQDRRQLRLLDGPGTFCKLGDRAAFKQQVSV